MILSIFDEDLKLAGVIDDYESFFAVLVHGDTSHARLTIRADKNNVDTLKRGNFIRKSDDMRLFYIADVATSYDDNGAAVSVTAYDVFYFLDGRITSAGTGGISNSSKTAEYTIKNWIDACLVNPTDADRTVGIIEVAANQDRGTLMNTIVYHTPLGDNIRNILSVDVMGVSGVYSSGKLLIDVYEGTDRSTSNTGGNSPVIFDIAYDNILSGEETESGVNAKNYAYVFSNRSGARVMVGVGTAIGANRREVGKATTETVSDDDMEILGLAELVESERGFSVSHDALRGSFEYGVDYVLGDIVTVAGRALRLIEVAQAWEAGKAPRLDLTFGMRGKTINAKTDDNTARLDDMEIQLLGVQAGGGSGDIIGPASSTDGGIVLFDGTDGKNIKDSAKTISTDGTLASNSDSNIPTEKAVKTYADKKAPVNQHTHLATAAAGIADGGDSGHSQFMAYGSGSSAGSAGLIFHRPNAFACAFGIDTDNELRVGGLSMGAVARKVYHEGNDHVLVRGGVNDRLIQQGWGYVQGNGTSNVDVSITFPTSFDSNTEPIVVCSPLGGAKATSGGAPTNQNDFSSTNTNHPTIAVKSPSNTGFKAGLYRSVAFSSSYYYMFTWFAVGKKTR